MPSSGRMALGLLFLTGCAARRFSLVFIGPRTARGGSPNRPQRSALHKQRAVARLRLLNSGWREILPDDQVRDLATQLLDTHSLRAADSLQLAASSIWCEQRQRPSRRSFICGDQRLAKAGESARFSVLELPRVVP
jgi:hypothetical protein